MRTHHGLYYDSRIKLLLILLTSALAFALGGGLTGLLLFGVVCLFSFLSGLWKTSIKFLTAYIALLMLAQILPIHLSSVITFFLLRILTIALALNILFQTTEIAELIASLQVSHIPQAIVIPTGTGAEKQNFCRNHRRGSFLYRRNRHGSSDICSFGEPQAERGYPC